MTSSVTTELPAINDNSNGAPMKKNTPFLTLDQERCMGCGQCEMACRRFIFQKSPENEKRILRQDKVPLCMHCGQCLAVCPTFAIRLDGMTGESLPENRGLSASPEQLSALMKRRRSAGCFSRRQPERTLLLDAVADAAYAPSASNMRSVRWKIIDTPSQLELLRQELLPYYRDGSTEKIHSHYTNAEEGRDSLLRGAPCVILTLAPDGAPWACTDCAIAVSYLELALLSRGVASCWAGSIVQVARNRTLSSLCLPEGYEVHGSLMAGYPAMRWCRLPLRNPGRVLFNKDSSL